MAEIAELLRKGRNEEAWQQSCGFIDLSLNEFMTIQKRLLLEQLELLKDCDLGKFILNGVYPASVEEFREQIPLTVYDDYAPYLLNKKSNALPSKPALWQYTSGKSGEYAYRWAPVSHGQLKEIESLLFALLFFSGCKGRNDINYQENDKILYGMAPPPYATGTMARVFPHQLFKFMPSVDEAEQLSFEERIQRGFEMSLSEGLDVFLAMSSVAVAIGDRFQQHSSKTDIKSLLKRPKALPRLVKGAVKSKLAHRTMLPRDLWSLRGLITFGIDSSIFRDKIRHMWGVEPLEFHGCTEAVIIATQTWDHRGMTFIPSLNFFEFIPEEESIKSKEDPTYQPKTLLLDEVKPGNYELVITSLRGGPFVRYRLGHMVQITSLRNEELDIDIPQMVFLSRVDDQIDIAGFTRLSEKTIWQAIENAGLSYAGWTARKETGESPRLHLYIELKDNGHLTGGQAASLIHEELKILDTPYAELESFTDLQPIEVTLLPENSFRLYKERQVAAGADLTQLSPPHINPPEETVDFLLNPAIAVAEKATQMVEV